VIPPLLVFPDEDVKICEYRGREKGRIGKERGNNKCLVTL